MYFFRETHHSDDLEVFQVRSLCGQNLFGNEVGLVGGIALREQRDMRFKIHNIDHHLIFPPPPLLQQQV